MPSRIVSMGPDEPLAARLAPLVDVLRAGGIVAFPTETFYGLGVHAFDGDALARLNRLKGKAHDSPILLLLADAEQADQVTRDLPARFEILARMFWPGPLTLVVPASAGLPPEISGGRGTVGIRVPGLALPRRIASSLGAPVTGVSANATGQPACRRALEVVQAFPEGVDWILDGGAAPGGAPSTVLDLCGQRPRILREGAVPAAALRPFLPDLSL